uniref:Uncharacterized protein n=1 Tax=Ciona savignyi TaxID=51511 RepID=H2Z464_CIOSA
MALYFDCSLESPPGSVVKCVAWHEKHAALAVCVKTPLLHRSVSPTAASWHPTRKLLAKGVFAVWKADARGRVQHNPLCRHDLGPAIVDCVAKPGPDAANSQHTKHLEHLARAAVSGDESALDMFADLSKSRIRLNTSWKEGLFFYVGTANGSVIYIDEKGSKKECLKLDSPVQQLLHGREKEFLIAISSDLQVVKFRVTTDGQTEEIESVKFSGQEGKAQITWAGKDLLSVATSDQSLRMWDLKNGDNFALLLDSALGFEKGECINTVSFMSNKGIIAAGTSSNKIAMWTSINVEKEAEPEDKWKLQAAISIDIPCTVVKWCPTHPVLAIGGEEGGMILTEQKMKWCLSTTMVAVQSGPRSVAEHIAVWNGKQVSMYEVSSAVGNYMGSFDCESSINALHDQSLFSIEQPKDPKDHPKGTVKQLIPMQENEGSVEIMAVNGNFVVFGTSTGCIKIYDLTRREAKAHSNTKHVKDLIKDFGSFNQMSCNCNGNKVAFICNRDNGIPDSRVFVYDCEVDKLESFDLATGTNETDD